MNAINIQLIPLFLQLFADPNDYVNKTTDTTATTGNDLSPEMKVFYDKTLLEEAGPNLVHHQFGQMRPIPRGSGKTIEFRKFDNLAKATTPLTEGVTPAGKKLTVTAVNATVAQYGDYVVQSDVLELTALDNTIVEATKLLGRQAGLTMDTVVRDIIAAGTNVSYADKYVNSVKTAVSSRADLDATAKISVDGIEKVVTKLKNQNAPRINGKYVAIVHPDVVYDLRRDPDWIDAHKYAQPNELYNGEVGEIAGVRFVESTEAKIFKGGSGDPSGLAVYACLFLGADAYGVIEIDGGGLETIVKQKGSSGSADPLNQRSSVGWKGMQTAKILMPNYIVRFECCSTFSATAAAN